MNFRSDTSDNNNNYVICNFGSSDWCWSGTGGAGRVLHMVLIIGSDLSGSCSSSLLNSLLTVTQCSVCGLSKGGNSNSNKYNSNSNSNSNSNNIIVIVK